MGSKEVDDFYAWVWDRRGVETPCKKCSGFGHRAYGNTATWRGGKGGQMITGGVCDHCWGSGDELRHGANLRELFNKLDSQARELKRQREILDELLY